MKTKISIAVLVTAYLYYYTYYRSTVKTPVVQIQNGKLQGLVSLSRDGKEFYEYLGIPFALPPVGPLRFESPQPADSWEGVRDASYYRSRCLQYESFMIGFTSGSEDCLYLNVFVPKNKPSEQLPVMFYIHGGLFHVGSADIAGPGFIMDETVILVSINYRLGALGFLNSGDGVVRGNMGLKDQNMALKWVRDNIKMFGGDPNRVTLFGESAGGASVHHHVLSPMSKGLFSKAIHQSGSSLHYWTVYRNVKEQAVTFAKKLNCSVSDSISMIKCLKSLDGNTLVGAHVDMKDFFRSQLVTFVPSIEVINDDQAFLNEEPLNILKEGRFNAVPLITGFTSAEGLLISAVVTSNQTKLNEAQDDWETWAPRTLHYSKELQNVTDIIRNFYFGASTKLINSSDLVQNYTDLFGDRLFSIQAIRSARLQSRFVPNYLYYYDYQGELSLGPLMAATQGKFHTVVNIILERISVMFQRYVFGKEPSHMGTSHGDEIFILFSKIPLLNFFFLANSKEVKMSKDVVKLWTDFAKDVKPLRFRGIEWPAVQPGVEKYLKISNTPSIIDKLFESRQLLWESLKLPDN